MIIQICIGIMVFCTGVIVGSSIVSWAIRRKDKEKKMMWREAENLADDFAEAYSQGYLDRDSEIVRCKDCEYCEVSGKTGISRCFKFDFMNEPDDYCSYGERKEK